ncbi:MAG: 4Fe-4S binding protein [Syntrophothermaceae bacterium]
MRNISRRAVQFITAIGINSYFIGFIEGTIYRGGLKNICFPGLNCSSCPGAWGSCPLALLQTGIAGTARPQFTFFIFGFLVMMGIIGGRLACGWFCPFGLLQELIYKIPLPKLAWKPEFRRLECLKYVVLVVFVILLPLLGLGTTAFCQYICPVEVLEAYFPLMVVKPSIMATLGFLFRWKLVLLIGIILLAIVIFKPFCRFLCPLGAIYSLFNPISLYRYEVDDNQCIECTSCQAECKLDIPVHEEPNHRECMRCNECLGCPTGALGVKHYGKKTSRGLES